jgi:hypothetical protein
MRRREHWRPDFSKHRGLGSSVHQLIHERKMELRSLLKSKRLPLFAVAASDVAERSVGRQRQSVERVLCLFRARRWLLRFPRFRFSTIFRSKNLRPL